MAEVLQVILEIASELLSLFQNVSLAFQMVTLFSKLFVNQLVAFGLISFGGVVSFKLILSLCFAVSARDPVKEATQPFVETLLPDLKFSL